MIRLHLSRVATLLIILSLLPLSAMAPGAVAQDVQILTCSPGESFTYNGQGAPNSNVGVEVSSSISVGTSGNRYERTLGGIKIPPYENRFSISVSPVKSMYVAGAGPMTFGVMTPGKSGSMSGQTGSFTSPMSIPEGTYSVKVYGEPVNGASSVSMNVKVTSTVHTDSSGKYSVTLSTSGLPEGVYTLKQGGTEVARVYLGVTPPAQPKTATLNLNGGWNLVSLPLVPNDGRIDSLFTPEQRSNIYVIWDFNGGDWKYWTTEPGFTNQIDSLDPSKGYYIYCYNPMSIQIKGQEGEPATINRLSPGWNLVGMPKTSSVGIANYFWSADLIWKYDGGNWYYWTTEEGYSNQFDTMSPGLGYWVYKL